MIRRERCAVRKGREREENGDRKRRSIVLGHYTKMYEL